MFLNAAVNLSERVIQLFSWRLNFFSVELETMHCFWYIQSLKWKDLHDSEAADLVMAFFNVYLNESLARKFVEKPNYMQIETVRSL